jgi:hypothetical protein
MLTSPRTHLGTIPQLERKSKKGQNQAQEAIARTTVRVELRALQVHPQPKQRDPDLRRTLEIGPEIDLETDLEIRIEKDVLDRASKCFFLEKFFYSINTLVSSK